MWSDLGRLLIWIGLFLVFLGVVLTLVPSLRLGRLPGDLVWRRGNWTLYFPVATSILLSLVLTLIFWLITFLRR